MFRVDQNVLFECFGKKKHLGCTDFGRLIFYEVVGRGVLGWILVQSPANDYTTLHENRHYLIIYTTTASFGIREIQ